MRYITWRAAVTEATNEDEWLVGRAWIFDDDVSADWQICPLDRLEPASDERMPFTAEVLGEFCMAPLIPDFAMRVSIGDFIVAGRNFGCSSACLDSSDEDPHFAGAATLAIKGAGIGAVLCATSNVTFLMNSLNLGLPVVECPFLPATIRQGDHLRVNLNSGLIVDEAAGLEYSFPPYPPKLIAMIQGGGVLAQLADKDRASIVAALPNRH